MAAMPCLNAACVIAGESAMKKEVEAQVCNQQQKNAPLLEPLSDPRQAASLEQEPPPVARPPPYQLHRNNERLPSYGSGSEPDVS